MNTKILMLNRTLYINTFLVLYQILRLLLPWCPSIYNANTMLLPIQKRLICKKKFFLGSNIWNSLKCTRLLNFKCKKRSWSTEIDNEVPTKFSQNTNITVTHRVLYLK